MEGMFRNYFRTAWRNLVKNMGYSALNILGLAVGMAIALIIGLWVLYQYDYDRSYPDYRQVYQARVRFVRNGEKGQMDATCLPMASVLKKEIPEIEYAVHTDWIQHRGLVNGDHKIYVEGAMAEADFFKIFPCTVVKGDLATALKGTYSIVLTESTAKALFQNNDPIGKNIRLDNEHDLAVTAVIRDPAPNSTLQFKYVVPFDYYVQANDWVRSALNTWDNNSFPTYVMLRPNTTYAQIVPKLKEVYDKYVPDGKKVQAEIFFQPMKDWHLFGEFKDGVQAGGFIEYVRLFSLIGVLVLIIACINFMNLSTARSEKRAREVGVRKAIGSRRKDLIFQFLIESLVITGVAAVFAIGFVLVALPSFNLLTDASVSIPWASGWFWAVMAGYVLLTGLLAGSRPAFYLSSFQPVKVLKGSIRAGRLASLPRKVLVVLQFTCSIALIISTFLIYQQIEYVKDRPTGYNADRLVMTDGSTDLSHNYPALRDEALRSGLVESMTTSSNPVTSLDAWWAIQDWSGKLPDELLALPNVAVGDDFFKTMGMRLVAGRNFTGNYAVDTGYVILNEAAVKRMRFKDPINQVITWNLTSHIKVIGVVKDAIMQSPFSPPQATMFTYNPSWSSEITFRLARNVDAQTAIAKLGYLFNKYNPSYPFLYHFVDDVYADKFHLEVLVSRLSALFAGLAIFISCLGLFGLAAYMAEQRTKEIGIRKVLGASVSQLWLLLSKDFILLVLISCVVASPIAFYFLHGWLEKYQYRITIGPWVFLVAAAMALLITIVTISFQAIRGALANPTRSLRTE
jgi:putative ABC transport system permease protein